ncbi:MAG: hypothetical protein SGPRY_012039, partial [Prymnesium sp.]
EELEMASRRFSEARMAHSLLSDAHKRGQLDAGISTAEDLAWDERQEARAVLLPAAVLVTPGVRGPGYCSAMMPFGTVDASF